MLPISVAVIVVSLIAIGLLAREAMRDDDGLPDVPDDPSVTAFWYEVGRPLLTESRDLTPRVLADINDGQTCRPSEEIHSAACPELPARYRDYARAYRELAARAAAEPAPAATSAEEWWTAQIDAWGVFADDLERMAGIGDAGFGDAEWDSLRPLPSTAALTEAEELLPPMLNEVGPAPGS